MVTGWKKVSPPAVQSPLPPEVRPIAVPSWVNSEPPLSPGSAQTSVWMRPGDGALRVVHGGVESDDLAVVEARWCCPSGRPAWPTVGLRGLADRDGLAVADVDLAGRLGRRVVVLDEGEVAVAGEGGLVDGGDRLAVLGVRPLLGRDTAVTGGQEGRGCRRPR